MKRRTFITGFMLTILTGSFLQSCRQDLYDELYDRNELIEQGRYITARSYDRIAMGETKKTSQRAGEGSSYAMDDLNSGPQPFEIGTPYRLLAFTKPYHASMPDEAYPVAQNPRFNKVAWESKAEGSLRFMNIDSEPDRWFGFSALGDEDRGDENLVSLDFYGFTYGEPEEHTADYITVDGWADQSTKLADLKHTESVSGGVLKDLMRGVLLNQNISTAGIAGIGPDGTQIPNLGTQSVMPFNHCFSKLRFQMSQQADEKAVDSEGNPLPAFENLVVESLEVTGSYQSGTVSLADGKVRVKDKLDSRPLLFNEKFNGNVTINNSDVGEMILFPSDGKALLNEDMADGYPIGLKITVKSTVKKAIENMLKNTESPGSVTEETDAQGVKWYKGTVVKSEIIDYYVNPGASDRRLYLEQNTSYMIIITFQKDAVRIISVIPMIEEWLPGEGNPRDPWQDQPLGQPQMFDNIVWSDRNLGAHHFDTRGANYDLCVGYFYQAGRNIPYFPFKYNEYQRDENGVRAIPDMKDITNQDLANGSSAYDFSIYRFFPVVDSRLLNMADTWEWSLSHSGGSPQMYIPETKPTDKYFNFMSGNSSDSGGLDDNQDMFWEKGQVNQPVSGSWVIPSSQEFQTIFPTTPHAGNLTFQHGSWNGLPMGWAPGPIDQNVKVLRVTVPYYKDGDTAPSKANASQKYTDAWNTLKDNEDDGCTSEGYNVGPGDSGNPNYEPDGDPEDGYASAYIISRAEGDVTAPEKLKGLDAAGKSYAVQSWGTIYAIKRIYTAEAYRMRWRVLEANKDAKNPCFYIEICRYRCSADSKLTVDNYKGYDWDHPAATIYLPICGLGDWTGQYINFGTECQYATSDDIIMGKTSAVQIKVTGNDAYNCYIAVVRGVINRNFGMQLRPVADE